MRHIPIRLRKLVILRARGHCEYCHLAQAGQEATFHIDHVMPVATGGTTILENLALACVSCSLFKGAKIMAKDPQTRQLTQLFNPRRDVWANHLEWDDVRLEGLTSTGRATIWQLKMNRPVILEIRGVAKLLGLHPF